MIKCIKIINFINIILFANKLLVVYVIKFKLQIQLIIY